MAAPTSSRTFKLAKLWRRRDRGSVLNLSKVAVTLFKYQEDFLDTAQIPQCFPGRTILTHILSGRARSVTDVKGFLRTAITLSEDV